MKNYLNALAICLAFVCNVQSFASSVSVTPPQLTVKLIASPRHCLGEHYYKFIVQASGGIVSVNKGTIVADTIKNVEESSTPLIVTVTAPDGQTAQKTILLPAIDAFPPQPAIVPSYVICQDSPLPLLKALVVSPDFTVDWYDQPIGGTKVATGSLTYQPTEAKIYYALSRNTSTNCVALSRASADVIVATSVCVRVVITKIKI